MKRRAITCFERSRTQTSQPTLSVRNLETSFMSRDSEVTALRDVSFEVESGKILGLVGESGSGKSLTAYSIMRLLEPPGVIRKGEVLFRGIDILKLSEDEMREIRGSRIAMVFQDPMMTLNPVLSIGTQMIETVLAHQHISYEQARQKARNLLGAVGISSPEERLQSYPHHLSGGMRQRVVIAMALAHEPDLIIADEATTALDVTIQGQILSEVKKLCRERHTSLIWITHDLSVIASLADDVCVMYAGQIVESGDVDAVLDSPRHPYTRGLLASVPSRNKRGLPLHQIPGTAPALINRAKGCAFQPRCTRSQPICGEPPALVKTTGIQLARCFFPYDGVPI